MIDVGDTITTVLTRVESALVAEFGHALLAVEVRIDRADRVVNLTGEVASSGVAARVAGASLAAVPPGWRVDAGELDETRTGAWRQLPPGTTALWTSRAGRSPATLTSQLVAEDGPVEVLTRAGASTLVRTPRGTMGWIVGVLGPPTALPAPNRPQARALVQSVAAGWLGAPYRLGGTLPSGVDCSGLLLRCFSVAWGIRLPRHSTDQVPDHLPASHDRVRRGDVVRLRTATGGTHVGLVAAQTRARPIVIHASVAHGRVVAEPLDRLAAGAVDISFVPAPVVVELHR